MRVAILIPASVAILGAVNPRSDTSHAATQRVPLPESSAGEPSALIRLIRRSEVIGWSDSYNHSTPSAPMPLCRSQIARVNAAASPGACSLEIKRKSFPHAVALTKGTMELFFTRLWPSSPAGSVVFGSQQLPHSPKLIGEILAYTDRTTYGFEGWRVMYLREAAKQESTGVCSVHGAPTRMPVGQSSIFFLCVFSNHLSSETFISLTDL